MKGNHFDKDLDLLEVLELCPTCSIRCRRVLLRVDHGLLLSSLEVHQLLTIFLWTGFCVFSMPTSVHQLMI